ncbi:putative cytoplasmic protein [Candidatus Moduliflexus flocculans]|uniref:Putative cytoplasmic protein n=1 Tax=Candidatus Moduliflexus flocculans TaxID=1499966 RepID=A0A0S6VRH9_9BACT|nr:putative cytoplasmic protein [Candidatus Moduliflexus flocculans]
MGCWRIHGSYFLHFTKRNLFYMRQFYLTFPILNALRSQLSWTHYRLLLKVNDEAARLFYLNEAAECAWSSRQLERQINSFYYQRLLASQDKKLLQAEAASQGNALSATHLLKNPYILEFLDLQANINYLERDLETAILSKLQEFLLELGKGFCFVARQQRITTEAGQHYYVDLVFYNYLLTDVTQRRRQFPSGEGLGVGSSVSDCSCQEPTPNPSPEGSVRSFVSNRLRNMSELYTFLINCIYSCQGKGCYQKDAPRIVQKQHRKSVFLPQVELTLDGFYETAIFPICHKWHNVGACGIFTISSYFKRCFHKMNEIF